MTYLTPAGVIHHDILDSCRSHALRYLTPAGVIHTTILDSYRSHTLRYMTPAGVIHTTILDSCRSLTWRQVIKTFSMREGWWYIGIKGGGGVKSKGTRIVIEKEK